MMSAKGNLISYLQSRELGGSNPSRRVHTTARDVELLLEDKAAKAESNQSCHLVGDPRSTFLMEFSPDGSCVASTHGDHSVRVTEIKTGRCKHTLLGHPRTPWCLAYHPSSNHILASGCLAGQVRIWDLYGGGCEVWQTEVSCVIASMCFHPVDHVLVFAAGHTIYFWDWSKPEPFAKCETKHPMFQRVRWVKFDSLGHNLYTGISNNTTLHRSEVNRTSTSNERHTPGSRSRLSNIYNNLRNCFNDYQRDRVMHQLHPRMQHARRLERRGPATVMSVGPRQQPPPTVGVGQGADNFGGDQPRSPVHEEGLSYARQYAFHVTNQASARNPAPTEGPRHPPVQSLRGVWSPPPQPRPQEEEEGVEHRIHTIETDIADFENGVTRNFEEPVRSNRDTPLTISLLRDRDGSCDRGPSTGSSSSTNGLSSTVTQSGIVGASRVIPAVLGTRAREGNVLHTDTATPIWGRSDIHRFGCVVTAVENVPASYESLRNTTSAVDSDTLVSGTSGSLGDVNLPSGTALSYFQSLRNASNTHMNNSSLNSSASRLPRILPYSLRQSNREQDQTTLSTSAAAAAVTTTTASSHPFSPMLTRFLRVASRNTVAPSHGPRQPAMNVPRPGNDGRSTLTQSDSTAPTVLYSDNDSPSVRGSTSESVQTLPHRDTNYPQQVRIIRPQDTSQSSTDNPSQTCTSQLDSSIERSENIQEHSRYNQPLRDILSHLTSQVPSVVASTSSYTSIFQNVTTPSQGSRGLLSSSRLYPSHSHSVLHNVTPVSSYFSTGNQYLSRNMSGNSASLVSPLYSVETDLNNVVSVGEMGHGPNSSHVTSTSDQSERLSAQTEPIGTLHIPTVTNPLNSGAYFQPITEDPRQSLSSASTESASSIEMGTDTALHRRNTVYQLTENSASSTSPQSNSVSAGSAVLEIPELDSNTDGEELVPIPPEIHLQNQDSNNNTIHLLGSRQEAGQTGSFEALRDNFVNMTDRIEREMFELNRRILALRQSYNESLLALRRDRERYRTLDGELASETSARTEPVSQESQQRPLDIPSIRVTSLQEPRISQLRQGGVQEQRLGLSQPRTLLETSLRSHHRDCLMQGAPTLEGNMPSVPRSQHPVPSTSTQPGQSTSGSDNEPSNWRTLHRHYLHPDYSSTILDDTINRPNNAIQAAIDRAIAGAFMSTGEPAVANNIRNQTHRIQFWDFTKCDIPDISSDTQNIVVAHCKLHNDTSCDISKDGTLLATFVPSPSGFVEDNILAVISLEKQTRGQCLYTKAFGPNAISVSISPRNQYVMMGLAVKQLSWIFTANQLVAQVYKLDKKNGGENSMTHTWDIQHPCNMDIRSHVGVNSAKWLPLPGQGLIYGTNKGNLHICQPLFKNPVEKFGDMDDGAAVESSDSGQEGSRSIRRNLMQMLVLSSTRQPRTINIATQTHTRGVRRSASTQTNPSDSD